MNNAGLDLSELFTDPDLVQTGIEVWRRRQVVGENGRGTVVAAVHFITGNVQPKDSAIGGNAMERTLSEQHRGAALEIHTSFRLRALAEVEGTEYQPDVVLYDGSQYVVTLVNDWTMFGHGYVQAELSSMASIDRPPPDPEPGEDIGCA